MTPAGMPARIANSPAAKAVKGVSSAGLITTVQPAANAGATLRVIMANGKFQGVMAAQTPMGCLITIRRRVLSNWGNVSPLTRLASSAYHSTKLAPYITSPLASAKGLPCSAVMMRPRSSTLAMRRSYHLRSKTLRSLLVLPRQAGRAALAAEMACSASAAPKLATSASFAPVAGSWMSKRLLPLTHWPLIKASVLRSEGSLSKAKGEVFMSMGSPRGICKGLEAVLAIL